MSSHGLGERTQGPRFTKAVTGRRFAYIPLAATDAHVRVLDQGERPRRGSVLQDSLIWTPAQANGPAVAVIIGSYLWGRHGGNGGGGAWALPLRVSEASGPKGVGQGWPILHCRGWPTADTKTNAADVQERTQPTPVTSAMTAHSDHWLSSLMEVLCGEDEREEANRDSEGSSEGAR